MVSFKAQEWSAFVNRPDGTAFAPVYEASRDAVFTLCVRVLGNRPDAHDAFQATYVRLIALARERRVPDGADPARLVYRLALREAGNLRKRRSRRARKERPLDTLDDRPAPLEATDETLDLRETRRRLEALVSRLPDRQRLPILLHFFHGLSQREVARVLDQSTSTVSYRIRKGLARLESPAADAGLGRLAARLATVAATAALLSPDRSAASVFRAAASHLAAPSAGSGGWESLTESGVRSKALLAGGIVLLTLTLGLVVRTAAQRGRASEGEAANTRHPPTGAVTVASPTPEPGGLAGSDGETSSTADGPVRMDLLVLWDDTRLPVDSAILRTVSSGTSTPPLATTDAKGLATVPVSRPDVPLEVVVGHPEAVERTLTVEADRNPGSPLTVQLRRDFVVAGAILDAETGEGVAGAVMHRRDLRVPDGLTHRTDDSGAYRLNGLAAGTVEIVARAPGYADRPARLVLERPGVHFLDFELEPAMEVTIRVEDVTGAPIAGARVVPSVFGCDGCYFLDDHVKTGPEGEAILVRISRRNPPNLAVHAEGFEAGQVRKEVLAGGATDVTVALERVLVTRCVITGRITDPAGRPIPGAVVQWKDGAGTRYADDEVYDRIRSRSDEAGRYRLDFQDDYETCNLGVSAPGRAPLVREGVRPGTPQAPLVLDFELKPAHWLEGEVTDEEGEPLVGARVEAMPRLSLLNVGMAYPVVQRAATTDGHGHFRLEGLPGPTVALRVAAPRGTGYPRLEVGDVEVDGQVRLTLRPFGAIRGRVVDGDTGGPVSEFTVKIQGPVATDRADPGESFSAADGRFELKQLDPHRRFGIVVEAAGYVPRRMSDLEVLPASSEREVEVVLSRGGILEGLIVDAVTGAAIPDARVTYGIWAHGQPDWRAIEFSHVLDNRQRLTTDERGRFAVREDEPGTLFVDCRGYRRVLVPPEARAPYQLTGGLLRIALTPGVKVAGTLEDDGEPRRSRTVRLGRIGSWSDADRDEQPEWLEDLSTDAEGRFAWEGVPAGEYLLGVDRRPTPQSDLGFRVQHRVHVPADRDVEVRPGDALGDLQVSGQILDASGAPLQGVLRLRPRFDWEVAELRAVVFSFAGARFHLSGLRPGEYAVAFVDSRDGETRVRRLPALHVQGDLEIQLTVGD